nr:hypothetical protein GCM10025699_05240 [Microbacterium flavescens]
MGRIGLTVLLALAVLALASCGSQLSPSQTDACNHHAAWVSQGSPIDDAVRDSRELTAATADGASNPVVTAVASFTDAVADENARGILDASERITDACGGAGWVPAEG